MEREKRFEKGFRFNLSTYEALECENDCWSKGITQTRERVDNGEHGFAILVITNCKDCGNTAEILLDAD